MQYTKYEIEDFEAEQAKYSISCLTLILHFFRVDTDADIKPHGIKLTSHGKLRSWVSLNSLSLKVNLMTMTTTMMMTM